MTGTRRLHFGPFPINLRSHLGMKLASEHWVFYVQRALQLGLANEGPEGERNGFAELVDPRLGGLHRTASSEHHWTTCLYHQGSTGAQNPISHSKSACMETDARGINSIQQ